MPSCHSLIGKYTPPHEEGYRSPFGWISALKGDKESNRFQTLLDTGAGMNFIARPFAKRFLGIDLPEIEKSERTFEIASPGGGKGKAYGWKRDLRLRVHDNPDSAYLIFPDAWVFVIPATVPGFPFLLGQLDGFHERWFAHYNHVEQGMWQLK